MTRFLREAAFTAVLTIAAPVWAQTVMAAEDQELNRLAYPQQPGRTAAPVFIADPVGLIVRDGVRYPSPGFPGLGTLLGLGMAGAGVVINTVAVGGPSQY
jgi:hypothetical protein